MRHSDKKESLMVILIVVTVVLGWAWYSTIHTDVIVEKPAQPLILNEADYQISDSAGMVVVGKTTRAQALQIYPEGSDLGRSGVYRPKDKDFLLTFTRKEEVLNKIDIGVSDLATARGIKVNDSVNKVLEQYGRNYTKAYVKYQPHIYDAMYGSDQQYVLFKVENNLVKKIVIGNSG